MMNNFKFGVKQIFKKLGFMSLLFVFITINFDAQIFGLTKNQNGIYEIRTKEDLYSFARVVNSGEFEASAKLMNDIVVNEGVMDENTDPQSVLHWECIGNNENRRFLGTFDGAGHTISGIFADASKNVDNYIHVRGNTGSYGQTDVVGLFGIVGDSTQSYKGTVKNLGLINSYFYCSGASAGTGYVYSGSICAKNFGLLENCYCENTTIIAFESNARLDSGGICSTNRGTINNCYCKKIRVSASGTSLENCSGGICSRNLGILNNCNVELSGIISANAPDYPNVSGGVCGNNSGKILNCYCSLSNVVSQSDTDAECVEQSWYGTNISGGICGNNSNLISNCYCCQVAINSSGKDSINISGGVCGENACNAYWGVHYVGENEACIKNCYSTSVNINATGGKENYKAGICGINCKYQIYNTGQDLDRRENWPTKEGEIQNCYYLKDSVINFDLFGVGANMEYQKETETGQTHYYVKTDSDREIQTKAVTVNEFKNNFVLGKLNSAGPCEGFEFKKNTKADVDMFREYLIFNKIK